MISYLARTELGCKVDVKSEAEADSWQHLADGSVDAILENWGHDDLKKKYVDDEKVAVEAGLTGNKGQIGWYVPPWMADEYPDITNWRNLGKYTDLFRTAKSGSQGQFLDGDPSYVTNDKALIKNLDLDFKVVYTGSEDALIQAFRDAEKNHKPMIGYFYEPQWLLSEVDLVNIKLPAYSPGCDADPETVRCDYQLRPGQDREPGVRLLGQPGGRADPAVQLVERGAERGRPGPERGDGPGPGGEEVAGRARGDLALLAAQLSGSDPGSGHSQSPGTDDRGRWSGERGRSSPVRSFRESARTARFGEIVPLSCDDTSS